MPSNVTDWGASQYLSILHGIVSLPPGYYVALCSDEPGPLADGSILAGLEPADTAYHRRYIPLDAASWADPTIGGYVANLIALDFGIPGLDWGLLPYFALCDSATAGEVFAYGEFNQPAYVTASYDVQIPPGAITLALSGYVPPIVSF